MAVDEQKIQELYKQVVEGDSLKAFNDLYDLLYESLFMFGLKIIKRRDITEEVVADVFTNFWMHRKGNTRVDNVITYLYIATRNRSLNELEKERRRTSVSLDDVEVEIAEYRYNPETEYISAEEVEKINRAMDQLPPRCKMVLVLTREQGLKYREVAEVMGISEKTVENLVSRALKKMAETLGISLEGPDERRRIFTYMLCL